MPYGILADAVVALHFLWILFLFLGGILGRKVRAVKITHLSGLGFAIIMQVFDWYCPLTDLEVWLRSKQDPTRTYSGSFIIHYLEKAVYLDISREMVFAGTLVLCAFNAWLYLKKKL